MAQYEQFLCAKRAELEEAVQERLLLIASLAREEAEVIKTGDQDKILVIDKRIEKAIGSKERAIGALNFHRDEHGC